MFHTALAAGDGRYKAPSLPTRNKWEIFRAHTALHEGNIPSHGNLLASGTGAQEGHCQVDPVIF